MWGRTGGVCVEEPGPDGGRLRPESLWLLGLVPVKLLSAATLLYVTSLLTPVGALPGATLWTSVSTSVTRGRGCVCV